MNEFALIRRFFMRPARRALLGNGDDAALLAVPAGQSLALSCDMLVEGRHFFADVDPEALGWKALAVNLSDLAAMAAQPRAFTLALALPRADEAWLAPFAQGLFGLADRFDCELIGGDTTRGPLTISITVFGEVPLQSATRRSAALPGDDIWVSGTLGDAALALCAERARRAGASACALGFASSVAIDAALLRALHWPTPRVDLGLALRGVAHAMIDVSDGLLSDLGHVLRASGCGATLYADALPSSPWLQRQSLEQRRRLSLGGGDDYELCFTAAARHRPTMAQLAQSLGVALTRIGEIDDSQRLQVIDGDGLPFSEAELDACKGFEHFD